MKTQNGFTLLEVLIAILLFSIGLLALASMQITAIRANYFSGALTEASNWAAGQMEQLLSLNFTHADLQDADGDGIAGLNHSDDPNVDGNATTDTTNSQADFQQPRGIYRVSWNVADNVTANSTKTVTVMVTWTERGSPKTFTLQGIKAR